MSVAEGKKEYKRSNRSKSWDQKIELQMLLWTIHLPPAFFYPSRTADLKECGGNG